MTTPKDKKILVVDLGGVMGGVEYYIETLSCMLMERGTFLSLCVPPELASRLRSKGIKVFSLPAFRWLKVVRFLLDHGADASLRTADGATPLYCASVTGRQEMARMLLEHGVDIEATNDQGRTPLQIASARQHKETVKLLLEYGAK